MPTPAAGSELTTAVIKTSQVTLSQTAPGDEGGLFNVAGTARRLSDSPLLKIGPGAPGPALRRGALVAVPVGLCLAVEFGFDTATAGGVATGALLAGFPGLDAPAGPRAARQAAAAPALGVAAAIGVLSSQSAAAAVLTMLAVGVLAGFGFAVSLRLAIYGLSVALALMLGQGLFLPAADALPALACAVGGALIQSAWSLLIWLFVDRADRNQPSGWDWSTAKRELRANLTLRSANARHAIRFGVALAAGVLLYRLLDLEVHGFWIPLTILFVMRPARAESELRMQLRAIGTAVGLVLATALAEAIGGSDLVVAICLTAAAAFTFGLLTVQYALFTAAITVYVVLLSDTLGESAFEAAGQRAVGTALGLAIVYLAFLLWPNPRTR